jgi:hypothetical protein
MTNIELIQIEILNQIINEIDQEDLEAARNTAVSLEINYKKMWIELNQILIYNYN